MSSEQFSLVWNSFPRNLSSGLYTLFNDEQLVDVTLAAEGQILQAHKLILSICSSYFKELFKINSCKHPIVILKDVNYRDLSAVLHFMYQGEVNVQQEDLASFLKVAETLQIKGLTKDKSERSADHLVADNLTRLGESLQVKSGQSENIVNGAESTLEMETDDHLSFEDEKPATVEETFPPIPESGESISLTRDHVFLATVNSVYNDIGDQQTIAVEPNSTIREILNTETEGVVQRMPGVNDEPLDYTSEVGHLSTAKNEPLDHTSVTEFDAASDNGYSGQENCVDDRESDLHAEKNSPIKASDRLEAPFSTDSSYNVGKYGRGKRTIKGITGRSLPLETRLRVVSELGPTLRMERGKVIRMYSCPWCLSHFTRKENLKLHVRYIHGPLENLTCKLCGNKYKNSNSLRVHSYLYHNTKHNTKRNAKYNTKRNKHVKTGIVDDNA